MAAAKDRVEMLDDTAKFDALKTHLKTTSSFAKAKKEAYNAVFEGIKGELGLEQKEKAHIAWVGEHYPKIIEWIRAKYTNGNTLRNKLEMVATTLLAIDKNKYKEIVRPLFNDSVVIQRKEDSKKTESVFSEKDLANYVPEAYLVARRRQLEKEWLADPKKLKLNMYHLLLAVNTYIPPIRRNWGEMEFWPKRVVDGRVKKIDAAAIEEAGPPPENETNYLWEQKPGEWAMVMQADKIEHSREAKGLERQLIPLKKEVGMVTGGEILNFVMNKSLEYAPRNYVLVGVKTKSEPMAHSSYDKALSEMFAPRKPTQNLIRDAYVNWYWRLSPPLSAAEQNEIAYRMRHSPAVARNSYLKTNAPATIDDLNVDPFNGTAKPIPVTEPAVSPLLPPREPAALPILPEPAEIKVAPLAPPKKPFDYIAYAKEYRTTHHAEIVRKKAEVYAADKDKVIAAQLIGRLNKGQTTRPMAGSILKYGLKQNDHTGKWTSSILTGAVNENAG